MPIVSSSHTLGGIQRDGRRFVSEAHTDGQGSVYTREYLAVEGANYAQVRDAEGARLSEALADAECSRATANGAWPTLLHQTAAEFASRFWARVLSARARGDQFEYGRLLWWLTQRLVAGSITDAQARGSFNSAFGRSLTAGQWTTLRSARITPAHDRYAAMLAETDL